MAVPFNPMAMRMKCLIYFLLPLLLLSCGKEQESNLLVGNNSEGVKETYTIPYSVIIDDSEATRATLGEGGTFASGYVFQSGDRLFVSYESGGNSLYGVLTLAEGAGTSTGEFEGDLTCSSGFYPVIANPEINYVLVGVNAATGFYSISGNRITAGPSYPSVIDYTSETLAGMVEKYSHFTASFSYNDRHITLTQQTVFLDFELELYRNDLILSGESPTVQVDIKSSDGNSVFQSVTGVPVEGSSTVSVLSFTTVFPAGTSLRGAQIWINNNGGIHCEPNFASDLNLFANHYYHVLRSAIEKFTVEAPIDGQGASVTFNYGHETLQYRRYTSGVWSDWEPYSSTISLGAGEKVSFRGQGSSYANTGGSIPFGNDNYTITSGTPLITVTNPVYIYGDIMSMVCDANWVMQSTVEADAFKFAFSGCKNINIPTDKDLLLSAETLGSSCYEGMFSGCTSLTKAPILAATTSVPERAYYGMFQGCSNLVTPPSSLPATTLGRQAYCQMFANCGELASAPAFPSTEGFFNGTQIFYRMFAKCLKLTEVTGRLFNSDTQLVEECYHGMFRHCRGLVTVPEGYLPSLTLAKWCYRGMFEEAAFTEAPVLPAPTLVDECYRFMFYKCSNLSNIKCLARYSISGNTPNFTTNVAAAGTFTKYAGVVWPSGNAGIPNGWTVAEATE